MTALAKAIESMESAREQTDPLGALRDWRVTIARKIIRPTGKSKVAAGKTGGGK